MFSVKNSYASCFVHASVLLTFAPVVSRIDCTTNPNFNTVVDELCDLGEVRVANGCVLVISH